MKNAMTVDVEDYFQVSAFDNVVERSTWDQQVCRVEQNTQRLLEIFAAHQAKATFFVLGWVAERFPQLVVSIAEHGHEIASHGYHHQRATSLTRRDFRNDVRSSKHLLEDLTGAPVEGYRAPSFSIAGMGLLCISRTKLLAGSTIFS